MSARWLLLRRGDALWAVPSDSVRGVHRDGGRTAVELRGGGSLHAERLLELAHSLECRSVPSCVTLAEPAIAGLAVWQGEPVLCLDPTGALPPALLAHDHSLDSDTLAFGEREDRDA